MKLVDAINKTDRLKANTIDTEDKRGWISDVDGKVYNDILTKAADYTGTFTPYTSGDDDKTLLIPFPYEDIYHYYLSAKIDFESGEISSYNNNMAMFNSEYDKFAAYYRRNHIPKSSGVIVGW